MHRLSLLLTVLSAGLGIAIAPTLNASTSTIHYRTSTEQFDECIDDEENCDADEEEEHKRWYHNHRYREAYDDPDDPTDELEYETAWPGKRDDAWNHLFR